jgi:hypothetical protein
MFATGLASAEAVDAGVAAGWTVGLGAGLVSEEVGSQALMNKASARTANIFVVMFVTLRFLKFHGPTQSRRFPKFNGEWPLRRKRFRLALLFFDWSGGAGKSVPGAVATGCFGLRKPMPGKLTRSLPLPVLTSG